jgi:diacylglycerol kinase (ATP)
VKWLVIVNRVAGRAREAERLAMQFARMRPGVERAETQSPGDGERLAREACDFDGLVVVGGDGTISECLTGMDLPRQRLAILPAGHGNCLARDLGIHRPAVALSVAGTPHWRALDLMDVSVESHGQRAWRRRCASTLAIGYVADVVATGRRRFPGLGHAAYAIASCLTAPRRFAAHSKPDGHSPGGTREWTGIVVNNTAHLANFRAFPSARLDDGLLDVMWQDCGWLRQQAHNLAVLAGSTAWGPHAMRQSAALRLRMESPRTLMADGEMRHGVRALHVECLRAAVTCAASPP